MTSELTVPSEGPAGAALTERDGRQMLTLSGSWRLNRLGSIARELDQLELPRGLTVDGSGAEQFDSAGALLLLTTLQHTNIDLANLELEGFSPAHQRILEQVRKHLPEVLKVPAAHSEGLITALGRHTVEMGELLLGHVNFTGQILVALFAIVRHPAKLRIKELAAQFEQVGLNAIPVAALVTLLIGVVFAYLLGLQAAQYGANIFVVDGVAIGATREFAPILVAVIVAGRSGAAFTAQIGSMRITEEIDAISTLGLSPMNVLVLPRIVALMVAMPLLVFIGDVMAILGALLIAEPMLGITPTGFLERLRDSLEMKHVYIGLIKAPVFALVIAIIGCKMGMTVGRDTRALGMATTSTVVQGIVSVILLDACFAILFQSLGL